ncbi:MAG: toxin-antitoxin system HicB family antitoxin [Oscillospiraceae bacterium]|nr:toxin-antitoxin system HicB family antitoxin [Oscillospiraceae bacterium]
MFEIRKPTASNKTIRMPDALIEKLERLATEHDISFNQLVIQCCEYAMEHLNQPDREKQEN